MEESRWYYGNEQRFVYLFLIEFQCWLSNRPVVSADPGCAEALWDSTAMHYRAIYTRWLKTEVAERVNNHELLLNLVNGKMNKLLVIHCMFFYASRSLCFVCAFERPYFHFYVLTRDASIAMPGWGISNCQPGVEHLKCIHMWHNNTDRSCIWDAYDNFLQWNLWQSPSETCDSRPVF